MPVPNKRKNEDSKKFMSRCMTDIPKDEYPNQNQAENDDREGIYDGAS